MEILYTRVGYVMESYRDVVVILVCSPSILATPSCVNPLPHGDANRHTIFKRKK